MYVAAFGLSLLSLLNISRVHVLQPEAVAEPTQPPLRVWRSLAFQRIALITITTHIAFFVIVPIVPLRLVDEMGADEAFMSVFALAELSSAACIAVFSSRIVRQIGTRATISIGMIGTGVAAILLAAAPSLPFTLIGAALSGASWTMAAISLFSFFSENTPPESITRYSTVYNQIVMLSVFVGPLLGSKLASTSLSLVTVMLIGAGLRILAGSLAPYDLMGRRRRKPQPAAEGAR
jgi:MFS family permease